MMTGTPAISKTSSLAWKILRPIAGLALLYYAWMLVMLVTHPFDPGANQVLNLNLFRWLSAAAGTFSVVTALFILRRLPGSVIALLLLLWGVGDMGWSQGLDYGSSQISNLLLNLFNLYFFLLAFPALTALLFHFPDGRVYPARLTGWAWGAVGFQSVTGLLAVLAVPSFQNGQVLNPFYIPGLQPAAGLMNTLEVLTPLAGVLSLALRYRASGQRQRLQIKWMVWLAGIGMAITILLPILLRQVFNSGPGSLASEFSQIAAYLYWQGFPALAIGVALLRYRLWDIDLIIRRTLQYGVLTFLMGLVYFGGVTLLGQGFLALTGQGSPLAVVLSTLAVAALVNPLRKRIQDFIDRRFYRQKYDAARALTDFSASARREVALEPLTADLARVVDQTVQPEGVAIWIRPPNVKPMEKK